MKSVSNLLWATTSSIGAGLCFLVLVAIGAVWWHPESRPCLDRVSFRIVTVALIANMIFGIASAVGGMMTHEGFLCGFSIFVLQLMLQISSFLLFCIALNLQLVVLHGFNGRNMEKFYITFSLLLSAILVIPPYAANQYGWDPLERDCWYKNDNISQRLAWQVSTQMAWTALAAIAEIGMSSSVLLFVLKHHFRMNRVFVSSSSSNSPQVIHSNSLRKIILRIVLYPIASCLVNLLTVVTALHSTISDGIHSQLDYNILLLSDTLYGGRPIVYAFLAASDPALVRGVKTLFQVLRGTYTPESSIEKPSSQVSSNALVVHIELTTIRDNEPAENSSPGKKKLDLVNENSQPVHSDEGPSQEQSRVTRSSSSRHPSRRVRIDDVEGNSRIHREEAMRQEMAALNKQL
ncbi:hypothetical protein GYMLUDRAFT_41075 [Collybiopsis luxurians FD-317 M1]|uniref:G-protein coupled receptors family 2 profile 2 domain-containing protein n=1 Tax=Collybiopsis luxurians FD-317 M1 TaxID=944289 RepID=A0A0D0CKB8_9AGAR|nr:hypothetical protein GYMLUDRAFT_41075 [Collybiopsis luxurians FD-317 M1]